MELTALLEPASKEVLGYGVLGVAVIALSILFWLERVDRKTAEENVGKVRDAAAAKIEEIQNSRVNEMRSAIDSIRKGDEVMDDMQKGFESRLEMLRSSVDALARAIGGGR